MANIKEEHHNLKLLLLADDVNSFGEMGSIKSVWLVFVINNNIPPWISVKREHIMLEMILLVIFPFNSDLN